MTVTNVNCFPLRVGAGTANDVAVAIAVAAFLFAACSSGTYILWSCFDKVSNPF